MTFQIWSGYAFFVTTSAFANIHPYSEEYMRPQGGEERAEYLQELKNSDPWFYVPPDSGASLQTAVSNDTSKHSSLHLLFFFHRFSRQII